MQADVGRRQTGGGQPVHHLESCAHAGGRIGEVEHHTVPQPLDGLAAVLHGAALHQPRDGRRHVGGRIIASLLGQPRVAGDVEETDRRQSLEAAVDAEPLHHHLEPIDDVGGPRTRLLRVIHGEEGLLPKWRDPVGEVGVPDLLRALARRHRRLDHLGRPPRSLLFGDPPRALSLDTEETLDGRRPESLRELELDERHDLHLVLAKSVIGRGLRHADRLADDHQQLEWDPGPVADLPERFSREGCEALVAGRVEELERQGTALHGCADAVEWDPGILERSGHQHAAHVARRETIRFLGRKDAELHQSSEIGGLDTGPPSGVLA